MCLNQENSNSIRVLNAALVNGYSIVTFQRPLKSTDRFDLPIVANQSQAIVWAIGPLNQRQEVSYHSLATRGDRFIQFGREPVWNCPLSENDNMKMIDENMEEFYNPNKGNRHQQQQQQFQQSNNFGSSFDNRPGNLYCGKLCHTSTLFIVISFIKNDVALNIFRW